MTQNILLRSIVYPSLLVLSLRDIALVTGLTTVLIWAICRALPKLPPDVRCWLWRLALLRYLIALFVPFTIPLTTAHRAPVLTPFNTVRIPTAVAAPAAAVPKALGRAFPVSQPIARPAAKDPPAAISAAAPASQLSAAPSQAPYASVPATADPIAAIASPKFWLNPRLTILSLQILACLYLLGVAACVMRVVVQGVLTRRFLARDCRPIVDPYVQAESIELSCRLGIGTPPALFETAAISSSMLLAGLHPAIVLPVEVAEGIMGNRDAQRLMLAHELTHLKRRDLLWSWLGTIVHTLFFFHPLVWLARREEALACEMDCDALTVKITESAPAAYGALLVKLTAAGKGPNLVALGIAHDVNGIRQRLIALKQTKDIMRRQRRLIGTAFAAALVAAMPWRTAASSRMIYFRPQDIQPATMHGRVVHLAEGTPGVNCSVHLRPIDAAQPDFRRERSGSCDVDGNFVIAQIDPGRYRVWTAGMTSSYSDRIVDIAPGARLTLPVIPLVDSVEVLGTVLDSATGQPVSDVEVTCGLAADGLEGTSYWRHVSGDGRFSIDAPPGETSVYARHSKNDFQSRGWVWTSQYALPKSAGILKTLITVKSGEPRALTIRVPAITVPAPSDSIPTITGRVVDPAGRPVGGAEVFLRAVQDNELDANDAPTIRTDTFGRFTIRGLSPRWRGKLCELRARDTTRNLVSYAVDLSIPDSGAPASVTLPLTSGTASSVFGRVVDTNGRPVAGAKVSLLAWSSRLTLQEEVLTDAAGQYAFNGLWPDLLSRLEVAKEGYGETVSSIHGDFALKSGERHLVASHVLEAATKTLIGVYVSTRGAELPGVTFSGVRGDSIVGSGQTDDQGRFRLDGLTPGPLRLYFNLSQHWTAAEAGSRDLRVVQN